MKSLLLAVCLGLLFRTLLLGSFPVGFNADEAAFGYNAFSLWKTGADEWSVPFYKLPLTGLKSFGDYKLPVYSFLAVPSVALLGLNEFAVRLPNALFGTLSIVAIYCLAKQLFPKSNLTLGSANISLASVAALMMAVNPWSIQLSRGAFEANLIACLLPLIVCLSLRRSYFSAVFLLVLSFYTYHSGRLLSLLVSLILLLTAKGFRKLPIFLFIALCLPGLFSLFSGSSKRVGDISILHPTDNWAAVSNRQFESQIQRESGLLTKIFTNKVLYITSQFAKTYLTYISPQFLITQGPKENTYGVIPGRGLIYYLDGICILISLYFIAKKGSASGHLIVVLLLTSPLAAGLAKGEGFAANRAAPMQAFIILLSAIGAVYLLNQVNKRLKLVVTGIFLILYFGQVAYFVNDYQIHGQRILAPGMAYGWKEAVSRINAISVEYDQVQVSRNFSEPHIFFAFYNQIDPHLYQKTSANWPDFEKLGFTFLDQYDGLIMGKYRFGSIDPTVPQSQRVLLVGKGKELDKLKTHFEIFLPDGNPIIAVAPANLK